MLIILKRDEWDDLAIVINHLGKPKLFNTNVEAWDYAGEHELFSFQIIQVTI